MIESAYSIESKIGTLNVDAHRLVSGNKTISDSTEEFFIKIGPREKWKSCRFEELLLFCATRLSNRDTTDLIDMLSDQKYRIIPTTVRNVVERQGMEIAATITEMADKALNAEDIKEALDRVPLDDLFSDPRFVLEPESVKDAADSLGIKEYNPAHYENPEEAVNISVDDICVKAQKPHRPMPDGKEKKKRVDNTVAHFENKDGKYAFNGDGMANVFHLMIGFMAFNNILLQHPIVFFTDGAKTIHNEIAKTFCFTKYKIILDYYHLQKKFKELFSMAFKGKTFSKEHHDAIMPLLWQGDVDGAIAFMANADPSKVKNQNYLIQLSDYLNRVRNYIPNYALRKQLGLRNGSGAVEKTNDLLVAKRQKHNGMSWSKKGSIGLATVTCACVNGDLENWTQKRAIPFRPIPELDMAA